jgi:(1->4)-alpha-D-glucan 1-alpha-D-glucosylmutase
VLTEMPDAWRRALSRWSRFGRAHETMVDGEPAPSRNDEYLFYQTMIGAWPLAWSPQAHTAFTGRMVAYMTKAAKEAKRETSWVNPNQEYESALARFVGNMLENPRFTAEVRSFSDSLSPYGAVNGLAQTLLKLWSPGVADTYQGSEIWDQRLVDPDNRTPVDYEALSAMLAGIRSRGDRPAVLARELLDTYRTGAVKLYVVHVALQARRDRRALVEQGTYEPLWGSEHVVAFGRRHGTELVVCAVPRFSFRLTQGRTAWPLGAVWGDEHLPLPAAGTYRHLYTGETYRVAERIRLAELFAGFPVALLTRIPD